MDSPIELPDGRLACGRHGLPVCGSCCVDYTFMDDELPDSAGELNMLSNQGGSVVHDHDRPGPGYFRRIDPRTRLPVQICPAISRALPGELSTAGLGRRASPHVYRFIRRNNLDEFLIFADGVCLENGGSNPRAGWAIYFKPVTDRDSGIVSGRLGKFGPWGDYHEQTNNRAELRAVLAALRFRYWPGEGFTKLVIATDSEYVVKGATEWVSGWLWNGWRTSNRGAVKNRDLWEALLGEFERLGELGLKVEF
ncbi:RNase H type-1 domain-containing protein [Fusarium keratoplasticum]|uniref:RNase H type-1 domain-containing protein n=1 Tax=Fusarium keratoplasticum TaxID=1328300 RepID=A0ACC0QXY7_9HYPO|nr:RNase H type-1 domain-containing protein [Fusarium keratoplasticum]KAI8669629.1 RNase H type-1 domain-containing protein [Fusarium keratoplasticum]